MKKLAITSIAVLIALVGFTAILVCLPCGDTCCATETSCGHSGKKECGQGEGNCSGKKEKCSHDEKSSCDKHGDAKMDGCGKGNSHHESCGGHEKRTMREWKDADGKVHKEVKVIVGGSNGCDHGDYGMEGKSCPMESGDHSGCCGCCMMKHAHGDSMDMDSVRVKVRGKL